MAVPRAASVLLAAGTVGLALVALAFVAAPRSCEGGLETYLWGGIAALAVWLALPFAARIGRSSLVRVAWSAGLVIFGVALWLAGLFVANVRFICGLGYL